METAVCLMTSRAHLIFMLSVGNFLTK